MEGPAADGGCSSGALVRLAQRAVNFAVPPTIHFRRPGQEMFRTRRATSRGRRVRIGAGRRKPSSGPSGRACPMRRGPRRLLDCLILHRR